MFVFDYHLHSLASDGSFSPESVVSFAHRNGVNSISLTDHDTISGLEKARIMAQNLGIEFIDGVELEADISPYQYCHILAYYIKNLNMLDNYLYTLRKERINIITAYIHLLQNQNYSITFDDVRALSPGEHLTPMHIATWLYLNNHYSSFQEAKKAYLVPGTYNYIPRIYHSYIDILKLIDNCGGVSVLAHPFRLNFDNEVLEQFVNKLKLHGLKGIEAYYSYHTSSQVNFCLYLAKKYNLVVTGGSDWHCFEDRKEIGIKLPNDVKLF